LSARLRQANVSRSVRELSLRLQVQPLVDVSRNQISDLPRAQLGDDVTFAQVAALGFGGLASAGVAVGEPIRDDVEVVNVVSLISRQDGRDHEGRRTTAEPGLILVTSAGGGVGGVGGKVVALLRQRGRAVRAMAHHDDDRADALRALGADIVVGDLTRPADVATALDSVQRMFFSMSLAPSYLEATATVATVARAVGDLDALVAISQMTVSQMDALSMSESHHQRLHWLSEQVLNWSGLPVVHVRPTVFLDSPLFTTLTARSIADSGTIRLPFGTGRTSPITTDDVARVVATILTDPGPYIGRVFELTGPRSQDMNGVAEEYARALSRPVTYVDVPWETWAEQVLSRAGLGSYVDEHIATMARLHRENRYDRVTATVEEITGRPAESVEEFIARQSDLFAE
jgi:uncharacterized protein YbjT (DUF2867 family)